MKKLLLAFAIVLMVGGSALAFAWWDRLEAENNVTIGVGQGVTVSVNLDEQTTGNLVPTGAIMKTGDVNEVDVEFTVSLSVDPEQLLNLNVATSNVLIGGEPGNAGLVNTSVTNPGTIQNVPVTVIITVTLNEPANQTEYDDIINQNITFNVTFTASVPE